MSVVALRTALIWDDEVMADVVSEQPAKITVGTTGKATFVTPDLGLPAEFAIVRPGNRGYLLTLGDRMRGTICIDGTERNVEEFVTRSGEGGDRSGADEGTFRATPISGRDWGVIELDETGHYKLFFQFVPLDEAPQFLTPKVLAGGAAGFVLSVAALAIISMIYGETIWEGLFRGLVVATAAVGVGALLHSIINQNGESQASLAFSILLHAALLFTTYKFYDPTDDWSWPGPRGMTGEYLATRAIVEPPPPPEQTVASQQSSTAAAQSKSKATHTATKGESGAAGGKGETERARTDKPTNDDKPPPPDKGVMTGTNRASIVSVIDRDMSKTLGRFAGVQGDRVIAGSVGFGPGSGHGVGDGQNGTGSTRGGKGKGPGGGGNAEGDFVTNRGKIDTGTERPGGNCKGAGCTGSGPKEVKLALASPAGDLGGYTEDEINRVVKARAGVFRICYQKELNRSPGIGGKLVVKFKIGSDGTVVAAAATGGSTLTNSAVTQCVTSNVMRLRFTPKGVTANVTFPFVFSQGG